MNTSNIKTQEVRHTIERLMQTATHYDVDTLEQIYHKDLKIVMVDTLNTVSINNKQDIITLFKSKRDAGAAPMNTWADYHYIEANNTNARVVLSRKNNLTGEDLVLFLHIDLVHEEGRWQVLHETVLLRPDET